MRMFDPAPIQETLDTQTEEFSVHEPVHVNKENGGGSQWRCPEEKALLEELSEMLWDIENPKDKMLEADPHWERIMTIHQNREKMLALYCTLEGKHRSNYFWWSF